MADTQNTTAPVANILEHKFRVEDNVVQLLIRKLQSQKLQPAYVGHIAAKVLEIVSQAYTRAQLADLVKHSETEYPELKEIEAHEEVYVKEQAEALIKETVEHLIAEKKVDDALMLAKTITGGTIPPELQEKINNL